MSSLLASAGDLLLLLLLLSIRLAILNVSVLNLLAGSRVLKIFDNLGRLITVSIHGGFFGYSFLSAIFNDSLLANGFAHTASAAHAKATRLERGKASAAAT